MKDAERLEQMLQEKTGFNIKNNCWMLDELEKLLNCYPALRKYNYNNMSLEQIKELIKCLSDYVEIPYAEDNDLLIVDLTEMKNLLSLKELILWLIIASLKDKSHVHFKYEEELFNEMKVSEANAIDYLCDNSRFIVNRAKEECHFILSVASILSFDYKNQDPIICWLKSTQHKQKKDLSLNEYINYRRVGQNIDDKPKLQNQSKSIKIKI